MDEKRNLVDVIIEAAVEVDGIKKLSCEQAFRLAERFGAEKIEIGRICDRRKIRIVKCQLGCFR